MHDALLHANECMDAAWIRTIDRGQSIRLIAWLSDLVRGTHFLSASFSAVGFCNSPSHNTQAICWQFDALAGLALLGMAVAGLGPTKKCMPLAAYCFAHGYGHYAMEQGVPEEVTTTGLINIASLIAIGWVTEGDALPFVVCFVLLLLVSY